MVGGSIYLAGRNINPTLLGIQLVMLSWLVLVFSLAKL
jgi:hypothetical protein